VWQANAFYAGGARPSPEIEAAARKEASGFARIDLQSGKVTRDNRKPPEADFQLGPGGGFHPRVGEYEFRATETIPKFQPGTPQVTVVTLTVLKGKEELWSRELVGNPWSPPPP
jgi:hypothetical protein